MLLAQNQSYNGIVRDLQASVAASPNDGVNDGVNGDKSIHGASQKVGGPKIMNGPKNEQIKILPYEANVKVCARTNVL